jgi:hypothetical protein
MAIRKSKVRQWAIKLNDGRFTSPETLVWEIAARGELATIRGKYFSAAYIDCSKCYGRVDHKVAATAALDTGCNPTIVALSFDMYKTPRIVQVHKSNTQPIEANRGILAGCAFAVHFLKAMIKQDVKDENNELRDYVDDMVLFKEGDTEEEAISGLYKDLIEAKNKLTEIGQVLNDKKEHIFVQSKTGELIWHQNCPDYKGRVGQAVIDLGITLRTHTDASLNKKNESL